MRIARGRIQRRRSCKGRLFENSVAGSLKMRDDPLGDNRGHHLVGVVDALPTAV
jgi:hypothetical protein